MAETSEVPLMPTVTRPAALLAGLLLALCVAAPIPAAQAASHQVVMKGYAYGPHALTISQGDTVTWTNLDTAPHDVVVTSGPAKFRSPLLSKGQSWSHTFTEAGSYSYVCSVHPDMHGAVTATAKPTPTTTSAPAAQPPSQPSAQVTTRPTPGATKATKRHERPHAHPQAATPARTSATPVAVAQTASLDPLVMVLGASTAVVVFCLLLMASRPPARPTDKP